MKAEERTVGYSRNAVRYKDTYPRFCYLICSKIAAIYERKHLKKERAALVTLCVNVRHVYITAAIAFYCTHHHRRMNRMEEHLFGRFMRQWGL